VIITKPREWARIIANLDEIGASKVFIVGCGQCATVSGTGGEPEVREAKARLEAGGRIVTGIAVSGVACHTGSAKQVIRQQTVEIGDAEAVLVLSCGAGVQTMADVVAAPVFPGLDSAFLGNVVRHGVFEERCQMCGECVLDATAGVCPVTTCPKGLLNGPCGGMWDGTCEVLTDRECTFVKINRRLKAQGRHAAARIVPPKDFSKKLKPGRIDMREQFKQARLEKRAAGGAGTCAPSPSNMLLPGEDPKGGACS
jgi:ferredoxin